MNNKMFRVVFQLTGKFSTTRASNMFVRASNAEIVKSYTKKLFTEKLEAAGFYEAEFTQEVYESSEEEATLYSENMKKNIQTNKSVN